MYNLFEYLNITFIYLQRDSSVFVCKESHHDFSACVHIVPNCILCLQPSLTANYYTLRGKNSTLFSLLYIYTQYKIHFNLI
jgi:hypothetical protein